MIANAPAKTSHGLQAGGESQNGEAYAEFSVLELLTTLAWRKWLILGMTFGTAIVFGGCSFLLKPRFTAAVTLMPPQQSASAGSAVLAQLGGLASLGGGSALGLKSPVDMYVALMRSASVEDAVVRRFDLAKEYGTRRASDTRKVLENSVSIEADPKDGLIRLTLTDTDAPRAAELANGYVDAYRSLSSTLAIGEAAQRRLFFEEQLEQEKDKLNSAQEELKRTEQTTGVVELDSQARSLIQAISSLRAQIAAKEVQLSSMRIYDASENPELVMAEEQLKSLRGELAKLSSETSGPDSNTSKALPQASLDYLRRLRDVKYNETLFDTLARQYEVARLDEAKEGAPIQIVDPATVPDRKSGPKRTYYVLGGAFLGAFIGILTVIFQAALTRNAGFQQRYLSFKQALIG